MSGDHTRSEPDYDQPRVPAALRDRINDLFVECRGYEPATFQESLSLVADLAAARIDEGLEVASDLGATDAANVGATDAAADLGATDAGVGVDDEPPDPTASANDGAAGGPSESSEGASAVSHVRADVVDDAADDGFAELEPGGGAASSATGDDGAASTAPSGDGDAGSGALVRDDGIPESLRADPESNCALCGDCHPVSVLQTTILDGAGSVALVCPDCAE